MNIKNIFSNGCSIINNCTIGGSNITMNENKIIINGKTYSNIKGNNISVSNGKVYVDGKLITDQTFQNEITIKFEGELANLKSDCEITVNGNVTNGIDSDGSVSCGNVMGDVKCGGSLNCDDIKGDVNVGGSVRCDDVGGSIVAGGSVRRG